MRHNGMGQSDTECTTVVGDGYDAEPLLKAAQVAQWLGITQQEVYRLNIPHVRIRTRSKRWKPADVRAWIEGRRVAV